MNKSHVSIGLSNPKGPTNVGAVMRAAGCYQVDEVFYTGQRYQRAAKFHTDTHHASGTIALTPVDALLDSLVQLPIETKVVCVELVEGAVSLPDYQHPEQALYLFGPEDGSLSQELVNRADAVVYMPTIGCMNLAASVNVLLYDRLAKSSRSAGGDALIRRSRDRNNSVKVGVASVLTE